MPAFSLASKLTIVIIFVGNFVFSTVALSSSSGATSDEGDSASSSSGLSSIPSRLWGVREQEVDYLFTTCEDLVCILDEKGHIQRLNDKGAKILGWSMSELLGQSHIEFVHPEDKEKTLQYLYGSHPTLLINRYQRKDGSYCWLDWVALPDLSAPTSGGNPILFARDITLQKTLEDKIRKAFATSSHNLETHNRILEMVVRIQASWVRDSLKGEVDEDKNLGFLLKSFLRYCQLVEESMVSCR
jgi:PAS domain S-box-containing protein